VRPDRRREVDWPGEIRDSRVRSVWERRLTSIMILSLSVIAVGCGTSEEAMAPVTPAPVEPAPAPAGTSPPGMSAASPIPTQVEVAAPPEPEPVESAPPRPLRAAPAAPRPLVAGAPPAAPTTQSRAAMFTTPDWTGEPVFVVHFASFTRRPAAERHAEKLAKETGLPARAVQVVLGTKGTWYRSVVGEFRTLGEALAAREGLIRKNLSGIGLVYRMVASK
jgi:SPOR domain